MPSSATQHWLDKAVEDEEVVDLIVANGGPWNAAAYHVQQATEKYLKALLVENNIAPPKTHDLPQLLSLMVNAAVPQDVDLAAGMTSAFAWQTRYPGAPALIESDVIQAIHDLKTVKKWVLSLL